MAARSTNTMVEVLDRMLQDLAQAKTAVDADMPFILQLETLIVAKLRDPQTQMQRAGLLPQDGTQQQGGQPPMDPSQMGGAPGGGGLPPELMAMLAGGGGAPGMMPGGAPGVPAASMPGPGRGPAPMPAAPNMDEMRRLLQ